MDKRFVYADNAATTPVSQAVVDAQKKAQEAQSSFTSINRLGISEEVVTYVTSSREKTEKIRQAQE